MPANINFFVSLWSFFGKVFADVLALNWKLLHLHIYVHPEINTTNFHLTGETRGESKGESERISTISTYTTTKEFLKNLLSTLEARGGRIHGALAMKI